MVVDEVVVEDEDEDEDVPEDEVDVGVDVEASEVEGSDDVTAVVVDGRPDDVPVLLSSSSSAFRQTPFSHDMPPSQAPPWVQRHPSAPTGQSLDESHATAKLVARPRPSDRSAVRIPFVEFIRRLVVVEREVVAGTSYAVAAAGSSRSRLLSRRPTSSRPPAGLLAPSRYPRSWDRWGCRTLSSRWTLRLT